jgi:hypothetical protein
VHDIHTKLHKDWFRHSKDDGDDIPIETHRQQILIKYVVPTDLEGTLVRTIFLSLDSIFCSE